MDLIQKYLQSDEPSLEDQVQLWQTNICDEKKVNNIIFPSPIKNHFV